MKYLFTVERERIFQFIPMIKELDIKYMFLTSRKEIEDAIEYNEKNNINISLIDLTKNASFENNTFSINAYVTLRNINCYSESQSSFKMANDFCLLEKMAHFKKFDLTFYNEYSNEIRVEFIITKLENIFLSNPENDTLFEICNYFINALNINSYGCFHFSKSCKNINLDKIEIKSDLPNISKINKKLNTQYINIIDFFIDEAKK